MGLLVKFTGPTLGNGRYKIPGPHKDCLSHELLLSQYCTLFITSADDLFKNQLELIRDAIMPNCFIIGDFNLDARMEYRDDYYSKKHLRNLLDLTLEYNLDRKEPRTHP